MTLLAMTLAVGVVSAGICLASQRPALMSALVAVVLALRFAAWARLPAGERWSSLASELAFFALCTAIGAFNDWNSVVRQRIYDYAVPSFFPSVSTIPLWMLVYWGMILRFLATLCRWGRLAPPARLRDEIHLPGRIVEAPWLKVGIGLLLVALTRWLVYRHYGDPLLSWLPFVAARSLRRPLPPRPTRAPAGRHRCSRRPGRRDRLHPARRIASLSAGLARRCSAVDRSLVGARDSDLGRSLRVPAGSARGVRGR